MTGKNQLAGETSPYLQQHRDNPVHWWPWGPAALDTARREDKPILLSVGYSACHWCHVMAHECFEDEEVAEVMNALFINIKVDREERPDIDQIYMSALHATGEQGGWPLTMFLTPEGEPFWGGTYFPKQPKYGRPGFIPIMHSVHKAWSDRRSDITSGADQLTDHVKKRLAADHPPADLSVQPVVTLGFRIADIIDTEHGGISGAPKFPNAPYMTTLWLSALETNNPDQMDHVINSLDLMLRGGIYDHVGGGLCRYSTDAHWVIPHFEKMLYDNAQLIELSVLAHAKTGNRLFRERIEETINWLEREMLSPDGAFTSSLDADSEGEEGKYYLWTGEQLGAVLGDDKARLLQSHMLVSPQAWEGEPVLVRHDVEAETPYDLLDRLLRHRRQRIPPGRDDKVLTDWNGLAIHAIALAARHFARDEWRTIAERAFNAIVARQNGSGRLPHSVNGDSALFPALSQDYAAMINAAITLYELNGDNGLIDIARQWVGILRDDYGDGKGGHYLTAAKAEDVPIRIRGDVDEAVPSATSQIVGALVRLASATGDLALHEEAEKCAAVAMGRAMHQSHGQAGIFNAGYLAVRNAKLVMVEDPADKAFSGIAAAHPDPRRVDITIPTGRTANPDLLPAVASLDTSQPGAWLCRGQSCLPPIRSAEELERMLAADLPGS